jgi:hypothetical protein
MHVQGRRLEDLHGRHSCKKNDAVILVLKKSNGGYVHAEKSAGRIAHKLVCEGVCICPNKHEFVAQTEGHNVI